jgi:hypothetical protein
MADQKTQEKSLQKGEVNRKMSRKEMVEAIKDALMSADDYVVEQIYEYLQDMEY